MEYILIEYNLFSEYCRFYTKFIPASKFLKRIYKEELFDDKLKNIKEVSTQVQICKN